MRAIGSRATQAVWAVVVVTVLSALVLLGPSSTESPLAPTRAVAWAGREPPVDVVFALLRLVAIAAGTYLLAALLIVIVADRAGLHPAARLGRRMIPASLRGVLAVGVGAVAVTAALAPLAGAASPPTLQRVAATTPQPPPTLRRVVPAAPRTTAPEASAPEAAAPPVPTTVPGTGAPVRRAPPPAWAERPRPRRVHRDEHHREALRRPEPAPAWVTVQAGDSFWSIARHQVGLAQGRSPTVGQVAPYWSRLMAANADRLPVPGQPDVLFPGDRLILPPGAP